MARPEVRLGLTPARRDPRHVDAVGGEPGRRHRHERRPERRMGEGVQNAADVSAPPRIELLRRADQEVAQSRERRASRHQSEPRDRRRTASRAFAAGGRLGTAAARRAPGRSPRNRRERRPRRRARERRRPRTPTGATTRPRRSSEAPPAAGRTRRCRSSRVAVTGEGRVAQNPLTKSPIRCTTPPGPRIDCTRCAPAIAARPATTAPRTQAPSGRSSRKRSAPSTPWSADRAPENGDPRRHVAHGDIDQADREVARAFRCRAHAGNLSQGPRRPCPAISFRLPVRRTFTRKDTQR